MRLIKAGGTNNPAAAINNCAGFLFCWQTRYTGSVLNLDPNTSYEIKTYLVQDGSETALYFKSGTVSTRPIPMAKPNSRVLSVNSNESLSAALVQVAAGDVIQLASGTYVGFSVAKSGSPGSPIVVRGGPQVVVNGSISVENVQHVIVEKLTVNGSISFTNSKNVAIVGNTVNSGTARGIGTRGTSNESDCYIADNIVTGSAPWVSNRMGVNSGIENEGIQFTGSGHVVRNNRVSGYRDCISFYEAGEAKNQYSNDIIQNDLSQCVDDAIEADSCFHNCRIIQNRITNSFMGISSQPTLGGPSYIVKNALYSILYEPFKLHNDTNGDVILNNTLVKNGDAFGIYDDTVLVRNATIKNNLLIGTTACVQTSGGNSSYSNCARSSGIAMWLPTFDLVTSLVDFQAYGVVNSSTISGKLGSTNFENISTLKTNYGQNEKNSVVSDLSVFLNPVKPPTAGVVVEVPQDFRLKSSAVVVGRAQVILNINDHVSQPSIGAFEVNETLPAYGPRP